MTGRHHGPLVALITALCCFASLVQAQTADFTYETTTNTDWSDIWSVVVFDGTNLVLSSEKITEGGAIKCAKYDLGLNPISSASTVASTNDTAGNDSIADHKHVFQDNHHFIAFSISGSGDGGYLYLTKFDRDFNRVGLVSVVTNDPPTNDPLMFGDGTNRLFVGNFNPGMGHDFYVYDSDLNPLTNYTIGGLGPSFDDRHANGSGGIFYSNQCHLVVQKHMGATNNINYYHMAFDPDTGMVTDHAEVIHTDPEELSLVTGISRDTQRDLFYVSYMRVTNTNAFGGGDLYTLILDDDWQYVGNRIAVSGEYHRPHNLIVSNRFYLSYDGGSPGVQLSSFFLGKVRSIDALVYYDFQTSSNTLETAAHSYTNLVTPFDVNTHSGSPMDSVGIDGRAVADTGWNTTNANAYFAFAVAVTSGQAMAATEFQFADQAAAGGPTNWELRTSMDGFTTVTASGPTHTNWTTNSYIIGLAELEGTNEFRIFGFHASQSNALWAIDDLEIRGYIEPANNADIDGDGLPNGWEYQHTGSITALDPDDDSDEDGATDYYEYVSGTLPFNNEHFFEIQNMVLTNAMLSISLGGTVSDRQYGLIYTDSLTGSVSWTELASPIPGVNDSMELVATNAASSRFYRVSIWAP